MNSALFKGIFLPSYLSLFHIAFIILMGFFGRYKFESGQETVPGLYASSYNKNHNKILKNSHILKLIIILSVYGRT